MPLDHEDEFDYEDLRPRLPNAPVPATGNRTRADSCPPMYPPLRARARDRDRPRKPFGYEDEDDASRYP